MTRPILVVLLLGALPASGTAQQNLKPADAPTFQLRARVVTQAGKEPAGKKFAFNLGAQSKQVNVEGTNWSDWITFGPAQIEATLKGYPGMYLRGYPVVVRLLVGGVVDPTTVEAELKFDEIGQVVKVQGELFGPRLGILLWRENTEPRAATMATYNQRYWKALENVNIPREKRPKLFPVVDRFIGGDDDRLDWKAGIEQLSKAGFNALMAPPSSKIRELQLAVGVPKTAWAIYNPPGYAFAFDPKLTSPQAITDWAKKQAKGYLDAGYAPTDMTLFAMSDEPGWYYPKMFEELKKYPAALTRFRHYLKAQGLQPQDVGAGSWEQVEPLGRAGARNLPSKKLFYWTMRFYAHDSAKHFADCTRELEKAFYPNIPVLTDWNSFSSRFYVPGPVANNTAKQDPDAAMGAHDWFEFGKLRGCTMLWTEDWFPDSMVYQWSFYCSKLRCAAAKGGVQFGGYIMPRTVGDREDGLLQRVLCIAGSGGKAIKYYVFGPEYNFPGNCYSERAKVLPKMAQAHTMIAAAEDLLWYGKRVSAGVAILAPRSAQVWDAKDIPLPNKILGAANTNMNGSTVDYMAEVFDLYLALQHANIPVDFVDEDDLSSGALKNYATLYVTEPNVPAEGLRGIMEWVKSGGTLVTVSGAGTRDRYDDPCSILSDSTGIEEVPREPLLVGNTKTLKPVAKGRGNRGEFAAVGVRGRIKKRAGKALAIFQDGAPAVLQTAVGTGSVVHFAWLPGLSYWNSSTTTTDKLPTGFSPAIRNWIVSPTSAHKERFPVEVSVPLIEAPLLESAKGAAVTLLNWTGKPVEKLTVAVQLSFAPASVQSVRKGELPFERITGGVRFALDLGSADIVLLRPRN
jgi:hypothetical protein